MTNFIFMIQSTIIYFNLTVLIIILKIALIINSILVFPYFIPILISFFINILILIHIINFYLILIFIIFYDILVNYAVTINSITKNFTVPTNSILSVLGYYFFYRGKRFYFFNFYF